jgi:hypothetical protein
MTRLSGRPVIPKADEYQRLTVGGQAVTWARRKRSRVSGRFDCLRLAAPSSTNLATERSKLSFRRRSKATV